MNKLMSLYHLIKHICYRKTRGTLAKRYIVAYTITGYHGALPQLKIAKFHKSQNQFVLQRASNVCRRKKMMMCFI